MNKYAFLTEPARQGTEATESYARFAAADAKHCEPRTPQGVNRYRSLLQDKSFSLTVRTNDGSTLLEAHVEYRHQAFQTLIDWSIDEQVRMLARLSLDQMGFTRTTEPRLHETLTG
jgi:hypothetical protein